MGLHVGMPEGRQLAFDWLVEQVLEKQVQVIQEIRVWSSMNLTAEPSSASGNQSYQAPQPKVIMLRI